MRALVIAGLLAASGCVTIQQLQSNGEPTTPLYGRAYFLKKTIFGTRVLVCDVRQASGDVVCYEAQTTGGQ